MMKFELFVLFVDFIFIGLRLKNINKFVWQILDKENVGNFLGGLMI